MLTLFANFLFLLLHYCIITTAAFTSLSSAGNRVSFWHVTDFHFDPEYSTNGDAANFCHANGTGSVTGKETGKTDFGPYGDSSCDSPYLLVQSAVSAMHSLAPKVDFIIWTGDSAPHLPDEITTQANVIEVLRNVTKAIDQQFPTTPLYASFGNHDYWPSDQFTEEENPIYDTAAELWSKYLTPDAVSTLRNHGYFRISLNRPANTVLLSLNTLLWYKPNNNTRGSFTDPAGQFAFTEETLRQARKNGGKVLIESHVPPGSFEDRKYSLVPEFNKRFIDLIAEYSDVISGLYFGHLHSDHLMFVRSKNATDADPLAFSNWVLAAPGVVPWHGRGRNPAIRYIELDEVTGEPRLLRQYYLNLTDANRRLVSSDGSNQVQVKSDWMDHYTWVVPEHVTFLQFLAEKYREARLSPEGFADYWDRVNVLARPTPDCNGTCQREQLCAMGELDYDRYDACTGAVSAGSRSHYVAVLGPMFTIVAIIIVTICIPLRSSNIDG